MNQENDWAEPTIEPGVSPPDANFSPEEIKTMIYEESHEDNKNRTDFEIRLRSVQDWFIRCSWIDKYTFLASLCESTQDFYVLENVLLAIENLHSKDVLSSFSKKYTDFIYDRIPLDNNKSLLNSDLQNAMKDDTMWFFNLNVTGQIRVILSLLRIGGGGLMLMYYKHINGIYQDRKGAFAVISAFSMEKIEERKSEVVESIETKDKTNQYTQEKLQILNKRQAELNEFKKKYEIEPIEEKKSQKGKETKETVEWIQVLPLGINRQIMVNIEDKEMGNLKKVGKYWGKMIEETLKEKAGRKLIDGRINKIKDGISVRNMNVDAAFAETEPDTLGKTAPIKHGKLKQYEIKNAIGKNKHIASRKWELKVLSDSVVPNRICALNFRHKFLASSALGGAVEFYSVRTGNKINCKVSEILSPITALALHEEGQHILIGYENGSLICKHIRKDATTAVYKGHAKAIISLFVTVENILSTSKDNTMKYFHIWSGLCLLCVNLNVGISISVAMPLIDKPLFELVGTEDGRLLIMDFQSKRIKKDVAVHDGSVMGLGQDKDLIITAGTDGKVRVWDLMLQSGKETWPRLFHNVDLKSPVLAIKTLNTQIFAACSDGNLRIICEINGTIFKTIPISSKPITGLELFHYHNHITLSMEMRTVSLEKYHPKSEKSKSPTRIKPKHPILSTRLSLPWKRKSQIEQTDSLTDMTVKSKPFKYIPANRKEKILEERFCTISELRRFSTPIRRFKTGVFAEMATRNSQNIIFKPVSRLKKFY